jgi:hypothetical protein
VAEAKGKNDFSAAALKSYRTKLEQSFVMKDIRNFQSAGFAFQRPASGRSARPRLPIGLEE